jgi:hypothetical protein
VTKDGEDFRRHGNDYTSAALIDAATAVLAKRLPGIPADFLAKLFGLAVPEDIERYTADELAGITEQSWSFLAERPAGVPKMRFEPSAIKRGISVLAIINDDMPFMVDSVIAELNQRGLDIRLFVHPVFIVERNLAGVLINSKGARTVGGQRESFIHLHIEGMEDAARRAEIVRVLEDILANVRVCAEDSQPMLARLRAVIKDLRTNPPPLPVEEIAETIQFLEWMGDDYFTLLGARDYAFTAGKEALEPIFETGLGLLRSHDTRLLRRWNERAIITPEIHAFLEEPKLLIITKLRVRSPVHRRVDLDYVGIKRFNRHGGLVGEFRFCGLFTSNAYTRPARSIPYLRHKIDDIIRRAGFDPSSHSGNALVNVLETYPRDELYQIDDDTLYQFALAILQLDERPRVRVLPRHDRFDPFVSILVYIPRERYDSRIWAAIGDYLVAAFKGRMSSFHPFFPEGPLVRVHYIIERSGSKTSNPDRASLEADIAAIVHTHADSAEIPTPPPKIPTQGYGPHFEVGDDGVIALAPAEAFDRQGNNVGRLKRLHPSFRVLSTDLIAKLGTGNIPHWHLRERAEAYARLIEQDLEHIDFALLYVEGVRLANAEKAAAEKITAKELPPLDAHVRETIDTLLQLHGAFMLATVEGIELIAEEERYHRTPQEEIEYRAAAIDLAQRLKNSPDIIDPQAASLVLASAEEIGKGANSERSGVVATGTVKNVVITVSTAATLATLSAGAIASASPALIVGAGATVLVVGEGLKKSKSFAAVAALVTNGLDLASEAEVGRVLSNLSRRLKPQLRFVLVAEPQLRRLAGQREELAWLTRCLDWIKQQVSHGS